MKHLLETGVEQNRIIEMAFDLYNNIEFRDPKVFYPWIKNQIKDEKKYYILLDEVQLLGVFISVLNGLTDTEEQKANLLDHLFEETYIRDIVKRYGIRNVREMVALL